MIICSDGVWEFISNEGKKKKSSYLTKARKKRKK